MMRVLLTKVSRQAIPSIFSPPHTAVNKFLLPAAPGFDSDNWPSMSREKRNRDVYKYHRLLLPSGLPAKCLVLFFIPGKCVLKMLRIKIWPIFVSHIEIRINRLHREKTTQSASPAPAYDQIQT